MSSHAITPDELLKELDSNAASDVVFVSGVAKKSADRKDEILFSQSPSYSSWVSIPTAMIEHAEILGSSYCGIDRVTSVRLALRTPSNPDATVLANLMRQSELVRSRDSRVQASDGTLPLRLSNGGTLPLFADGTLPLRGDGTLPLRGDGTLPLRGDGTLPFRGPSDGTLPLFALVGNMLVPLGWRFGNG